MKLPFAISFLFLSVIVSAQIDPGFDKEECKEILAISAYIVEDTGYTNNIEAPKNYEKVYRSPVVGLDNLWELWMHKTKKQAVINIRGTTDKADSWLLNVYAAMIPARGTIQWGENNEFQFDYNFASHEKAGVHVGWTVGLAELYQDIGPKIDSLNKAGIKNIIITGHSQGGGIAYLLNAHVKSLQKSGQLDEDIRFKTYCTAAPKPGNLYFAYAYEALNYGGWAFNLVNAADWVPEVPMSIQTLNDFNNTNPFIHAEDAIKNQKWTTRIVLSHIYKKLSKPTFKAQENYEKYLGEAVSKFINEKIPNLKVPEYLSSNNYARTGDMIVLQPEADYYEKFPDSETRIFVHHFHHPYLYLLNQLEE